MTFQDDDAVTPVVGTVLILLITRAGIGAVLAWGVPAVQGIQDQSNLASMEGEFSDIRLRTLQLSIVDSARTAFISLEDGELSLEQGDRFAIIAVHDVAFKDVGTTKYTGCDVRVTGWSTTSSSLILEENSDCGVLDNGAPGAGTTELGFELDKLVGSSVQSRPSISVTGSGSTRTITSAGDDLSDGDWRLRLVDGNDQVHVQVFILETKRIAWHLQSSVSTMDLYVEAGAMFHADPPQVFNLAPARVNEEIFVTGDYLMEFPAYTGNELAVTAPSNPQVFLQLQGQHGRVVGQDTLRLRIDIAGDLAEAWCNHLVFRTDAITAGTYAEDSDATCLAGDGEGIRSVTYEPTTSPFPFELIHKRVYAAVSA